MAEGHLVVRWARRLRSLVGRPLVRVELPTRFAERAPSLVGQHVAEVASHGKHLLVHFSGGATLHCHAMMFGSWQVGRPGMKLRKPRERVRVRLRTAEREAVFFNGPVAELLTASQTSSMFTFSSAPARSPALVAPSAGDTRTGPAPESVSS